MGFTKVSAEDAALNTRQDAEKVATRNALADALRELGDGEAVSDGVEYAERNKAHNAFIAYERLLSPVNFDLTETTEADADGNTSTVVVAHRVPSHRIKPVVDGDKTTYRLYMYLRTPKDKNDAETADDETPAETPVETNGETPAETPPAETADTPKPRGRK